MIQRILATNDVFATVLLSTTKAPLPFTDDDIKILKDIEKILGYFQKASEKISGGKYVTLSLKIPMAYGLYRQVDKLLPEPNVPRKKYANYFIFFYFYFILFNVD